VKSLSSVFIWTEAFNCVEILPPFIASFTKHHNLPIHVFTTAEEVALVPKNPFVTASTLDGNFATSILLCSQKSSIRGYRKGHLGTARVWSNIIRTRHEEVLIHLDADTVFLGECIQPLLKAIQNGADLAGTRRPYFHRTYRKSGRDGAALDKHPDAINTDIIAFRRRSIPDKFSPFLTRLIRGKRPLRFPVVDFFDPVVFKMLRSRRVIEYVDSPEDGSQSKPNQNSSIYRNRISFAAVGSGLNFMKNPQVKTSPGYREYALSSYSIYSKYLLDKDIPFPALINEELEKRLRDLDKSSWTLREKD